MSVLCSLQITDAALVEQCSSKPEEKVVLCPMGRVKPKPNQRLKELLGWASFKIRNRREPSSLARFHNCEIEEFLRQAWTIDRATTPPKSIHIGIS
ncbi:unnamed protein product [Citrullus colocynthis]|uniref:Uncharacterized protein n=1 Tax=Citrullus colocynthis TaxID=252529 RepID=A0ABP0YZ10_9ROSI